MNPSSSLSLHILKHDESILDYHYTYLNMMNPSSSLSLHILKHDESKLSLHILKHDESILQSNGHVVRSPQLRVGVLTLPEDEPLRFRRSNRELDHFGHLPILMGQQKLSVFHVTITNELVRGANIDNWKQNTSEDEYMVFCNIKRANVFCFLFFFKFRIMDSCFKFWMFRWFCLLLIFVVVRELLGFLLCVCQERLSQEKLNWVAVSAQEAIKNLNNNKTESREIDLSRSFCPGSRADSRTWIHPLWHCNDLHCDTG